jgi:hypothetical protein
VSCGGHYRQGCSKSEHRGRGKKEGDMIKRFEAQKQNPRAIMAYYVIRPNIDLKALLKQHPYMSLPAEIVKVEEAGKSRLSYLENIEFHKLFHLASMDDYLRILADRDADFLSEEERLRKYHFMKNLLGDPPYSRSLFDRWWTIEKINLMKDYVKALKNLPISSLEALEEIESSPIASLLEWIIQLKKEGDL